jgi:N-acetylglucosamine-6-phosphate deacetylase
LWRCKGAQNIALVTDAVEVVGTDADEFQVAGTPIKVRDGRTWSPNGGLAGSVLTLNRALSNIREWLDLSLEEILPAATTTPARVVGLAARKGSIAPGKDADVAIFTEDLEPVATIVEGSVVYQR